MASNGARRQHQLLVALMLVHHLTTSEKAHATDCSMDLRLLSYRPYSMLVMRLPTIPSCIWDIWCCRISSRSSGTLLCC